MRADRQRRQAGKPAPRTANDNGGPLADAVRRRLDRYVNDPLKTVHDAAADSGVPVRSLFRYARGAGAPDPYNCRLLMEWLHLSKQQMRELIEAQKRV